MQPSPIHTLPEEILLEILGYLDSTPPSELRGRHEPGLQLTSGRDTTLKNVCRVSKRWRRIGLPILFKYARLRLDSPLDTNASCSSPTMAKSMYSTYTTTGLPSTCSLASTDTAQHHVHLVKSIRDRFPEDASRLPARLRNALLTEESTARWALTASHRLQDLLTFVQHENLRTAVESFVLLTDRMLPEKYDYLTRTSRQCEWHYIGAATLWRQVFSVIDPSRVMILAPPFDLACLTNAVIDTSGDWAFSDMAFHSIDLHRGCNSANQTTPNHELRPLPKENYGFAPSSVVYSRPWTHIAINEGSFLRAYGTYEYFERGPPSLIHSINQCFMPGFPAYLNVERTLRTVRSFTYTGIFPFANHARFRDMLPFLEELDCRFAPDPESGILDDKARVGRAELQDCWQELTSAYQDICSALATHNESFPNVKKFVCGDSRITGIKDDLEDLFMPLCLPAWAEMEPGVFHRLSTSSWPLNNDENDNVEGSNE